MIIWKVGNNNTIHSQRPLEEKIKLFAIYPYANSFLLANYTGSNSR